MAKAFKKLNFLDLKLHDQFDGGYSTISRWNDAVMDYLTDRDDSGDFSAVCISGLVTGQNNGTSTYQNDARRVVINGEEHLAVKIRRMGAQGDARPHPRDQAQDNNQSQFLIGLHEEAISDKPISKGLSSLNPGDQIKCYYNDISFIDASGTETTKRLLMFRADSVGGSFINAFAKPLQSLGDSVSDSFNNVQNPNFLGPSSAPDGTNGKLFPNQLRDVGGGYKMADPAATAYMNMRAAAQRDGITWTVNEAYRTIETQMAYDSDPCQGPPAKGRYGRMYNCNGKQVRGLAARAGTSKHGLGKAIDINVRSNPKAFQWLMANASRFKFYKDKKEDWHWEYRG